MEGIITGVFSLIADGDGKAIIGILVAVIVALGWYCFKLISMLEKKDEKIYKIFDDYSKNAITVTEAMNSLKTVLIEIKAKL